MKRFERKGRRTEGGVEVGDAAVPVAVEGMRGYLDALGRGDWEGAAACFSEDVVYSHPPYDPLPDGTQLPSEVRGRAALLDLFTRKGAPAFRVDVTRWAEADGLCFAFGTFEVRGQSGTVVAVLQADADGRIAFYAPFVRTPHIGSRVGGNL